MMEWIRKFVFLFNRKSLILIQTPRHRSFGNCAEEMFFGLLRAKREGKKILFLYPRPILFRRFGVSIANRELYHLESDLMVPIKGLASKMAGWLLTLVYVVVRGFHSISCSPAFRRLCRLARPRLESHKSFNNGTVIPDLGRESLWNFENKTPLSWESVERAEWEKQYQAYTPPRLKDELEEKCLKIRRQMGIPLSDWFVCLHVPEVNPPTIRSSSIQNYLLAAQFITRLGGWVVRIGDNRMSRFPHMDRVIDYAHSSHKTEYMDLYLMSSCRFMLGTNSGPPAVAFLFRRPYLLVNLTEWSLALPLQEGDLAIPKHIFSKSRNRFLSVREILDEPFSIQSFGTCYDNEYLLKENTAEEIRDLVEEYCLQKMPFQYSSLQAKFNQGRRAQIRRGLEQGEPRWPEVSPGREFIEQYRLASRLYSLGTFGHSYLSRNWEVDRLQSQPSSPLLETIGS